MALAAGSVSAAGFVLPAAASEPRVGVDASRLEKAGAGYSYYRGRGWGCCNRNAAIAGAVGVGLLGAAAIAANRPAYSGTYYYDDGYAYVGYGYQPAYVYEEPVVVYQRPRYHGGYYGPGNYYSGRGPYGGSRNGTTDPARGGN
ncbi:hypothetical protein BIWAKO_05162 [Bosea sp. BIWAKO-01]|nr:hypothetical protein BIWAKO_05162 [Bosea sp. BIWAKO-01]